MARKKNNKKEQTFNVYPYLGQYQYLMRTGGQLPWYQDKGSVDEETVSEENTEGDGNRESKYDCNGRPCDWPAYVEHYKKMTGEEPPCHLSPDGCPEGDGSPDGEESDVSAAERLAKMSAFRKEHNIPDGQDLTQEQVDVFSKWEQKKHEEGNEDTTTPIAKTTDVQKVEKKGDCPDAIYKKCALESKAVNPKTCECEEKIDAPDNVKQQAIEDYQNGKISKKEMEDIIYSHNLGKGLTKGKPDYELSPTSKWGLLADAVDSTGRAIKGFGRQSINPKTGKPYTAADFKQTTIDMSKVNNVNDAQLYWDDANLKKFLEEGKGYKDMNVSDLLGTSTMHSSRRLDDFQDYQQNLLNEYVKSGDLESSEDVISRRSMDRVTGDISYDDVTEDVENEIPNPEYDELVKQMKTRFPEAEWEAELAKIKIPKTITETESVTRAHTDDDLTSFDKARDKTKNYSTTDLLINKEADVTGLVRTGPQAEPNVIGPEGGTNLQIEDYDETRSYEDNIQINTESDEQRKKRLREKSNEEENIEDNKKVASEVDNGDGTFTITYSDGTTKTVMRESNQGRKNKKINEGKMGLETFVYGGQPKKLDKYQWRGEKVHDFLEYHPNFPRTSHVPYTGDFTADQLQNAITRDSTTIENSLDDSWFLRNFIGQDQTHQSNMGPAGKLQLNREWLHKLLMQDDQKHAKKLNFYKDGGALPKYQDENSETDENKSKGPQDPPDDINEKQVVVEEVDIEGEINEDAEEERSLTE